MSEFRRGNGAVWLDLLSSLAGRWRGALVDDIGTPQRLHDWLAEAGLEPAKKVTERERELVVTTREALHRVTSATIAGERPDDDDVKALAEALAHDVPPALTATDDGLDTSRPPTASAALAWLVRDAISLLTSEDAARLRHCGDDTCASIFIDRTGRRRWCLDLSCGNRMRVQAHRARTSTS